MVDSEGSTSDGLGRTLGWREEGCGITLTCRFLENTDVMSATSTIFVLIDLYLIPIEVGDNNDEEEDADADDDADDEDDEDKDEVCLT